MPDLVQVLRSVKDDPSAAVKMFGPPLVARPGTKLIERFLFLPPKTDAATINHVSLTIDGAPLDIPGRYLSAAEKQALVAQGREQESRSPASP